MNSRRARFVTRAAWIALIPVQILFFAICLLGLAATGIVLAIMLGALALKNRHNPEPIAYVRSSAA